MAPKRIVKYLLSLLLISLAEMIQIKFPLSGRKGAMQSRLFAYGCPLFAAQYAATDNSVTTAVRPKVAPKP